MLPFTVKCNHSDIWQFLTTVSLVHTVFPTGLKVKDSLSTFHVIETQIGLYVTLDIFLVTSPLINKIHPLRLETDINSPQVSVFE